MEAIARKRWPKKACLLLWALLLLPASLAWSQTGEPSARDLLETQEEADRLLEEREESDPKKIDSRRTPLDSMLGLCKALNAQDYKSAGEFLDMRYLPEELDEYTTEDLIIAFAKVWTQQNFTDLGALSDDPRGNLEDGLPNYREQIGSVTLSSEVVPIYLHHTPDGEGGFEWKLSNHTVARIPEMWDELGPGPVAVFLSELLPDFHFLGMDNWQVIATVLLLVACWPIAAIISGLMMRVALLVPNRIPLAIQRFFKGPMRFFIYFIILRLFIDQMGLSLTARVILQSSGMTYIAYTILLLGLFALIRDYQIRKLQDAGNTQYVALLKPFTTILNCITVTVIALFWAESAGYNMSTILAGLGVGSVAVALAAQKTLENIIGAVTLYTARPVSAGDFCRFGDTTGTVEEIGLRSTLIRTLDRTLMVIPNSVFASRQIENFARRDRIRYYRHFRLQFSGPDQLRYILAEVRKLLLSHPEVPQDTVSVRFEKIEDATALLRVDAGVRTTDFQQYLAVAEDLNLRFVEVVHQAGALFAGPGQLLQIHELKTEEQRLAQVGQTLQQWRADKQLPFPDYPEAQLKELKDSLDYPPGSTGS